MADKICFSCHRFISGKADTYNIVTSTVHVGEISKSTEEFVLCPDCMAIMANIIRLNDYVEPAQDEEQLELTVFFRQLEKIVITMANELGYAPSSTRVSELLVYIVKKIKLEEQENG